MSSVILSFPATEGCSPVRISAACPRKGIITKRPIIESQRACLPTKVLFICRYCDTETCAAQVPVRPCESRTVSVYVVFVGGLTNVPPVEETAPMPERVADCALLETQARLALCPLEIPAGWAEITQDGS